MITILSDIERKILRIIYNYFTMRRTMPSIHEIEIKTGRDKDGVYKVLKVLNDEKYIEWSETLPEQITLIEGWERQPHLYRFIP